LCLGMARHAPLLGAAIAAGSLACAAKGYLGRRAARRPGAATDARAKP
jgi:hypothetical protein